ncbi:MAG TPA: hypothetical protein DIT49_02665 [Clostridiales bacterium]|nr:hypothetical protein [Clostridiales bacterium]
MDWDHRALSAFAAGLAVGGRWNCMPARTRYPDWLGSVADSGVLHRPEARQDWEERVATANLSRLFQAAVEGAVEDTRENTEGV